MAQFELILIVLSCVVLSSAVDKLVSRVSLPVLQVIIGLIAAILVPGIREVRVESELFLVLFIAPLLFNETREANVRALWQNKGDILSLAIGLVLVSTIAVGAVFNALVPAVSFAAAVALGAALGPTDAAATSALGASVNLTERQKTLLSGESLINDASGVVAFQFSVAAAVTGAFSMAEATGAFLRLFVGGIAVGLVVGFILAWAMRMLERLGLEDVTSHALFELLAPFIIYLFAEGLEVSGILAVVAAGLIMARERPRFHSTFEARRKLVSDSLWSVVSFLINGILFVLLGMQLPHVVTPGLAVGLNSFEVIGLILAVAATVVGCRFVWVYVLELMHRRSKKGDGHWCGTSQSPVHDALITTIGGAKGAVTLSIVLTLPYMTANGEPFPSRDLIVTVAAGVILVTLLLADSLLPRLAPRPVDDGSHDREVKDATIAVFEGTIEELQNLLEDPRFADYVPALRLTLARYQVRLSIERLQGEGVAEANKDVEDEEYRQQADELEQLHQRHLKTRGDEHDWQVHLSAMRQIRYSVGYQGRMANVVNAKKGWRSTLAAIKRTFRGDKGAPSDEEFTRVYGQACLYAIELEYVSIDCFDRFIKEGDEDHAHAASIRRDVHEMALQSLWSRLNYGRDDAGEPTVSYVLPYNVVTHEFDPKFREQFAKAREYGQDVDENALRIELDQITRLQAEGRITRDVATELRQDVYLLQMNDE